MFRNTMSVPAYPYRSRPLSRSYRNMTGEEIQLDRYAKFRKLGQFQEFAVRGGDWRNAIAERKAAAGVRTKAGAWAVSEAEAKLIERLADGDEDWEKLVAGRSEWVNRPVQPPGLSRSGVMEMAVSMVELRRKKQGSAATASTKTTVTV